MNKIKILLLFIFRLLVVFGFVFELRFLGPITTRRLSCIIAIIFLLYNHKDFFDLCHILNKKKMIYVFINFFISSFILFADKALYSGFVLARSQMELWYFLNIFIYDIVFAIYSVVAFKNVASYARVYVTCFIIQTIAVVSSVISTPVRLMLYDKFYNGDDRFEDTVESGLRIMGINLHSATGGMLIGSCACLLVYMALKKYYKTWQFLVLYTMILIISAFISRTGLILCIALLLFFVFSQKHKVSIQYLFAIIPIFVIFTYVVPQIIAHGDSGNGDLLIEWISQAYSLDDQYRIAGHINQTELSYFHSDLLFGTSQLYGYLSDGVYVKSDSGYVRIIMAVGYVGAFFYYIAHFYLYKSCYIKEEDKRIRSFFGFLILSAFILEVKEPFSLKYVYSYMIFTLSMFSLKEFNSNNYTRI